MLLIVLWDRLKAMRARLEAIETDQRNLERRLEQGLETAKTPPPLPAEPKPVAPASETLPKTAAEQPAPPVAAVEPTPAEPEPAPPLPAAVVPDPEPHKAEVIMSEPEPAPPQEMIELLNELMARTEESPPPSA